MNRCRAGSMARSWSETAYHDGSTCQAAGPDGVTKRPRLVGRCWAAISAPSFGFKSCAKSSGKNRGSTIAKGGGGTNTRYDRNAGGAKPTLRLLIVSPLSGTYAAV